jgi:hypothetical protein
LAPKGVGLSVNAPQFKPEAKGVASAIDLSPSSSRDDLTVPSKLGCLVSYNPQVTVRRLFINNYINNSVIFGDPQILLLPRCVMYGGMQRLVERDYQTQYPQYKPINDSSFSQHVPGVIRPPQQMFYKQGHLQQYGSMPGNPSYFKGYEYQPPFQHNNFGYNSSFSNHTQQHYLLPQHPSPNNLYGFSPSPVPVLQGYTGGNHHSYPHPFITSLSENSLPLLGMATVGVQTQSSIGNDGSLNKTPNNNTKS